MAKMCGIKKKPVKRIGSSFGRRKKKQGNDVSVASSGEGDYTSGGTAEVGPSGERGIIHVEYVVCSQIP